MAEILLFSDGSRFQDNLEINTTNVLGISALWAVIFVNLQHQNAILVDLFCKMLNNDAAHWDEKIDVNLLMNGASILEVALTCPDPRMFLTLIEHNNYNNWKEKLDPNMRRAGDSALARGSAVGHLTPLCWALENKKQVILH